jgi:hypothetical protein
LRGLKVSLTSLTMLLVLCAPALAQSAPAASQYSAEYRPGSCDLGAAESQVNASVGAGACDSAENAGQGTVAVNGALTGTASSASPSASPESASAESDDDRSGDGEKNPEKGLASITELPETGGAPIGALGLGVLLAALGLMTRKAVGR